MAMNHVDMWNHIVVELDPYLLFFFCSDGHTNTKTIAYSLELRKIGSGRVDMATSSIYTSRDLEIGPEIGSICSFPFLGRRERA